MHIHFSNFPKTRPPLSSCYEAIYEENYKTNRNGQTTASSAAQKVESWMHKKVAKDLFELKHSEPINTLEIGAGTLNQLKHEKKETVYDIIEPQKFFYEDSPYLEKVNAIYSDINDIPDTNKYDRIISIATFEHICNLPEVVERSKALLKSDGQLRVAIPSEGGFLWGLSWRLTTGLEFYLRHKLSYKTLMEYEHVNSAQEIQEILEYYFPVVKSEYLGLGRHLSLFQFLECRLK